MKKSQLFALFLALLLTASACGASGDSVVTGNSDADTATSEISEPSEYQKPDVDYGGETFTFLDYDTEEYFWHGASYSDIHADEETGDPINDAQYRRNVKVEELLNINIETYPVGGVARDNNDAELQKLILAGDDTVDAAFLFAFDCMSITTAEGMLQNLLDISTLNLNSTWWKQDFIHEFTMADFLPVITGDISLFSQFAPQVLFFNKNLAEQYQVNDLYDLVRDGKWTWDKCNEYCQLVSADLNGDSVYDEADRYGMALQTYAANAMIMTAGIRYSTRNADGTPVISLNTEKTANFIEFLVPFINAEYNDKAQKYSGKYGNVFAELHIPMFKNDQLLFNFQQLMIAFELRAMEADYGLLPMPKYDEAQENYCTPMSTAFMTLLCVPATNEKPEMAGHVFDAMGFYSQQYVTPEYIDTTIRLKSIRDEESAEMLELILDTRIVDIASIYGWGNMGNMINKLAHSNNSNFASAYASNASKIEAELTQTLEQLGY
ncbi:MAG: hypothetical protein E7632_10150 [Ruminococcaceae bacterium]|nr:hypothetical protein [Oscillospiraceae bacterium]